MRHNFFSKTPFSKLLMFMRQSEKIWKMLLATRWSLVGARVTKFVYIYLCDTTCFSKTPFSKLLMFMRQSEKIRKMLLATRWSLVGARVTTFVYIYLCDTIFFQNPLFKVVNVHETVRKNPKNASCDTLVTCWSKRGHKFILYTWWCQMTGDLLNLCSWCCVSLFYDLNNLTPTSR